MKTKKITTILVEDEKNAIEALQKYIEKYCPQLEIIGTARNAKEGIKVIHDLQPQLVFLDVEMPYGNAFDVLEACQDINFETIFVTAYAEYAIKALNQSASYYLLKPVSIEELITAVQKVQQHINDQEWLNRKQLLLDNHKAESPLMQRIMVPLIDGFEVVQVSDIYRLKGNGNFTDIHLRNGEVKMVCRFLKHFEELLSAPFVRIHRSHIINLNDIKKYHKGSGGYITLQDNTEIEVGASYKDELIKMIEK